MVSEIDMLEEVSEELMDGEPEVVRDTKTQIVFPFLHNVRLSNFVRFYHPDGTTSDLPAPTFNPQRPTNYRKRFLQYWLGKRGPNGGRWFFLKPQAPRAELPHRCFVAPGGRQCTKRLPTIPDLYMHVMAKHGEEAKLYADVLEAMRRKMQTQLDPETVRTLGLGESPAGAPAQEGPEVHYCRVDGCPRFFDSEAGRNQHEYTCPQKKKEAV